MLPLQVPGGPELLIVFLIWGVMALLPIIAVLVGLYLLYKIRKDVASMSRSLQRIADTQAAPSSGTSAAASGTGPGASASTGTGPDTATSTDAPESSVDADDSAGRSESTRE